MLRRIKCDESRPGCNRCAHVGLQCPGYLQPIRFVETVVGHAQARFDAESSRESSSSEAPESEDTKTSSISRRSQSSAVPASSPRAVAVVSSIKDNALLVSQVISMSGERDARLLASFTGQFPYRLWYTKNWFAGVCLSPEDRTLKTAVRALITAYGAMIFKDDALRDLSRHSYGSSLRVLRKNLAHPQRTRLNALQNSIMVLAMVELYERCLSRGAAEPTLQGLTADTDESSDQHKSPIWVVHAKGIEQIMRRQGPDAYARLDMNRLFYSAMKDTMVSCSLRGTTRGLTNKQILLAYEEHTSCFLDQPDWLATIYFFAPPHTYEGALCALHAVHLQVPRLAYDVRHAPRNEVDADEMTARAAKLHEEACAAFQYFMEELEKVSKLPHEIASASRSEEPTPAVYDFQDVWFPDVLTPRTIGLHHSFLVIINNLRRELRGKPSTPEEVKADADTRAESRASAVEICKCLPTIEKMPVTLLGIFSLAYPVFFIERVLEACPEEYRAWAEQKRKRWTTA